MPPSRRAGKAASEPQKAALEPQPAAGSSSSAQDVEVASATSGWTPGGGTTVMNVAAQDVRTRLQAQATALRQYTDEFLATRAAIRDYHNLRAAAFNSQARELTQKTADLTESWVCCACALVALCRVLAAPGAFPRSAPRALAALAPPAAPSRPLGAFPCALLPLPSTATAARLPAFSAVVAPNRPASITEPPRPPLLHLRRSSTGSPGARPLPRGAAPRT
ncbi:uncharacterized protein [Aegilops tauschii subsp. strangulata]|uniref:uncharacterized protein n=1 Tax=Aegilops tauschii subsp. strangulata TaxID=200361 RepID=UPI003CC8B210